MYLFRQTDLPLSGRPLSFLVESQGPWTLHRQTVFLNRCSTGRQVVAFPPRANKNLEKSAYFSLCCSFLHGIHKEATHKIGAKLVKKAELIENLRAGLLPGGLDFKKPRMEVFYLFIVFLFFLLLLFNFVFHFGRIGCHSLS